MNGIEATENNLKGGHLYVKKPFPIQAQQINETFWVRSLEGNHQGHEGDYLLRGIKGELYICAKDIFEETYTLCDMPMAEAMREVAHATLRHVYEEGMRPCKHYPKPTDMPMWKRCQCELCWAELRKEAGWAEKVG